MERNENDIPEEIHCGEQVFDLKFHPHANVLATGLINGMVNIYNYSSSELLLSLSHHNGMSCRGLEFNSDGTQLYTISSDNSWVCVDQTGQIITAHLNAHQTSINKCLLINESNLFVTGDDNGCVKLWDIRVNNEIGSFHKQNDFITSLNFYPSESTLFCTSGDSTLCTYDIRKRLTSNDKLTNNNVITISDEQESELTSVEVLKYGKKIICGTQKGVILIFSWGKWGDCTDRYPGHPQPIDCMLKIDDNTILTGSSDGLIRVVGIQPNKIYGVLGDHEDFPVEGMCRSRDGLYLGTFSHDDVIRFWDMSMFVHDVPDEGDEENGEGEDGGGGGGGEEETKGERNENEEEENDDYEDMSEEEGDGEGEEDEEEEEEEDSEENGDDSEGEEDSSDDDDDDDKNTPKMPPFKFPQKQSKRGFYADL